MTKEMSDPRKTRNSRTPLGVATSIERGWVIDRCPIAAQFLGGKLGGNWGWSLRTGAPIDMATPNGDANAIFPFFCSLFSVNSSALKAPVTAVVPAIIALPLLLKKELE